MQNQPTETSIVRALRALQMSVAGVLRIVRSASVIRSTRSASTAFALSLAASGAIAGSPTPVVPAPFSFAVIGNGPFSSTEEAAARRLLEAIGQSRDLPRFIIDTGNLKAPAEACDDNLVLGRLALLDSAPLPLFYVPGENEWVACQFGVNGSYDPRERLDFIREHFYDDDQSFGTRRLPLARQSASPRFRPYRENMRWQSGDVVFVTLNVPGDNNHYLNEGGRNGEYEERSVANIEWLERAEAYAHRTHARAIVIAFEGDPQFEAGARQDHLFGWLRFDRQSARDGYAELKQALLKLTQHFEGPVLLIDGGISPLASGYRIDQPLRDEHGARVLNFARLEVSGSPHLMQWIRVTVEPERKELFRISVQKVPARLPAPAPSNNAVAAQSAPGSSAATAAGSTGGPVTGTVPGTPSLPLPPDTSGTAGIEAPKMLPLPPAGAGPSN